MLCCPTTVYLDSTCIKMSHARLCLNDSYTGGSDVVLSDYSVHEHHLHQGVLPVLRLSDRYQHPDVIDDAIIAYSPSPPTSLEP
jgi:hypothetical protein